MASITRRFSSGSNAWFSPSEPRKIIPVTPEAMSASAWAAVASRSSDWSCLSWVVMAGNTPCQYGFFICFQLFSGISIKAPPAPRVGAASSVHQLFYVAGFDGYRLHQVHVATPLHENVILQSHRETFLPDVDARFNRKHPARLHGLDRVAQVVHIKANRVSDSVHEIF